MSMPMPGGGGPEVVTQESLLLGALERIARIRHGRLALHIHLSRLRPQNRQEGHIRIALRMLEPMVNAYRGQMFLLSNSDVVFMLKEPNLTDVENMIYKLRALFSKDPLTFLDTGEGADGFCTWFDLGSDDYARLVENTKTANDEARKRARARASAAAEIRPIDANSLGDFLQRLAGADISPLIRRQAAMVVNERINATVMLQEMFVGTTELQKAMAPDINLLGNRWLFQHLSLALDQKVLAALREPPLRSLPEMVSLNLNIASVLSPAFAAFAKAMAGRTRVGVEVQVLDALADSRGFYRARKSLRDEGHTLIMDGLTELTLRFMDVSQFDADLYKLHWSPEMRESEHSRIVALALAAIGPEKVILARCDTEQAIHWGLGSDIRRFQGRYVDSMLAAYTMAVCDKASACTLGQCIMRHFVVSGGPRPECGNLDMLDSSPVMRAPATRRKGASA